MSQQELLARVVAVLERAGVDYMVTGSFVSSLQGEPRASHDIDVLVELTAAGAKALLEEFTAPDHYLDDYSVRAAMSGTGAFRQFNLLEVAGGNKVDFWILSDEPFDRERFARKYVDQIGGLPVRVSRPEDTILMKLVWVQMSGGSQKQFADALAVYELQAEALDVLYVERWAAQLGVTPLWEKLKSEARPI